MNAIGLACETPSGDRPGIPNSAGCKGGELVLLPPAFPSGPAGKPYAGGFYDSGVLVIPKPRTWSASFPKAGSFTYDCLIHPGMDATVSTA